jgi:hypothetical protein
MFFTIDNFKFKLVEQALFYVPSFGSYQLLVGGVESMEDARHEGEKFIKEIYDMIYDCDFVPIQPIE